MDTDKYNRSVGLVCPTCGGNQFEFEGSEETIGSAKCASCGREFTKDELIEANSENISEHVKEMGDEITKDFAKEMRESLKKGLRGSKNIRIK